MKRLLSRADPKLYQECLSFATVRRIEQQSPILLVVATAIGAGTALPAALFSMSMWLLHFGKRSEATTRIIESQAKQQLVAQQMESTVRLRELLSDKTWDKFTGVKIPPISDAVLEKLVEQITPTVAELHDSPLIGEITFGISAKKD